MIATFETPYVRSTPKYSTMIAAMKISSSARNFPCVTRYVLARLVDQLGDLAHRAVDGQVLQLIEDHDAEEQTEGGYPQADISSIRPS
jgi:hypothetical protein